MNLKIPGYDIKHEPLGRGAMATVYLAIQRSLGRPVALKVMKSELTTDPELCERFVREGRALAQINHPHVVTIIDVGCVGDVYYMAMEYLAGGTLEKRIKSGMQAEDAMRVLRQIADALMQVHEAGIIHRDIKPANILFRQNGTAVLSDFGVIKLLDSTALTAASFHPGTYEYMSPEQVRGLMIDHRSDLYSLGIVLYKMLTGDLPFDGQNNPASWADLHCYEPVPRLVSSLAVYQALIDSLLAKKPDERMPSAQALLYYDLDDERKRLGLMAGGTIHRSEKHKATGSTAIEPVAEGKKDQSPRFRWQYAGALLGFAILGLSLRAIQMRVMPVPPVVEPASLPTVPVPPVAAVRKPSLLSVPPFTEAVTLQPVPITATTGLDVPAVQPAHPLAGPDSYPTKPFAVFRDTLKDGSFGPEMVSLPGGSFLMGSPRSEVGRDDDEGPQHWVSIQPFAIGRTEVSFMDFDRFAEASNRKKPDDNWGRGDRPVINVTWSDANAYAEWLGAQTGKKYRLPTEAEWEYAARAGTTRSFWIGDCVDTSKVNYNGRFDYAGCGAKTGIFRRQTVLVGSLPSNPWGLHEMTGNLWEWVEDCSHNNYNAAPTDGAAWLQSNGGDCANRMLRGGSWYNGPQFLRAANRFRFSAVNWGNDVGIRLARTP